jgi:hypothetical protein
LRRPIFEWRKLRKFFLLVGRGWWKYVRILGLVFGKTSVESVEKGFHGAAGKKECDQRVVIRKKR